MKQTPLYDRHLALGGKIIDFGGWALPVQYSGITAEHQAVRTAAGLFDVSHMGEFLLTGPDALDSLQQLLTNDISKAKIGQVIYSPMCAGDGGVIDDLLVYRLAEQEWLLVVNAGNTDVDRDWIGQHLTGRTALADLSQDTAQVAVQGPAAASVLQQLTGFDLGAIRFYRFEADIDVAGVRTLVSRTGYTGEDGFELYLAAGQAARLWDALLEAGRPAGMLPAGLGARDILRFEAAMPLYGHELTRSITPLEAGLERFVKLDKPAFVGRDALAASLASGLARRRVGIEMLDRGIARSDYTVQQDGKTVGYVTSGMPSPTLRKNLAMAMLEVQAADPGCEVSVIIRGQAVAARVVPLPFYRRADS